MNAFHLTLLFLAVLAFGSTSALAQEERSYLRFLGATAEYSDLHYVELNDEGEPLLEEAGGMTFVGIKGYWQFKSGLFTELSYREATDTVDYRGVSQQGRFLETQTELHIQDANFLFGRNFGYTAAFLGVRSYFRERNILGVDNIAPLYEELEHTNAIFGLRGNIFPKRRFQIRLEARIWTDIDSSFYVASPLFDASTITPGKSFSYRTSVEFFFNPVGGLTLSLIPAYEYTQIDKSRSYPLYRNGEPLHRNQHQPKMEWETYSLTGEVRWHF